MLPTLKVLLDKDHRRLFLKDNRIIPCLGEIKPDAIPFIEFGGYPPVEAPAFAAQEIMRWCPLEANYFGAHSRWTRQTVLTEEGYLIVRDLYEPGKEVDGFQAGPVWCLRSDGESKASPIRRRQEQCWFDAPAWEHAWWQKQQKRVPVYIHPQDGQTYGQVQHETTPDISRTIRTDSSLARAIVAAGKPKVFLSILRST